MKYVMLFSFNNLNLICWVEKQMICGTALFTPIQQKVKFVIEF